MKREVRCGFKWKKKKLNNEFLNCDYSHTYFLKLQCVTYINGGHRLDRTLTGCSCRSRPTARWGWWSPRWAPAPSGRSCSRKSAGRDPLCRRPPPSCRSRPPGCCWRPRPARRAGTGAPTACPLERKNNDLNWKIWKMASSIYSVCGKDVWGYLRIPWAFIDEEITHDRPVGVARQDAFTRSTDTHVDFTNKHKSKKNVPLRSSLFLLRLFVVVLCLCLFYSF